MTQPHQIDREAVALLPCPFCLGAASVHRCEHAFHDAKVRCGECNVEGPIFDVDDGGANEAGRNEDEAIAAWNRRPAPMEAVAWRWRVDGVGPWIAHHGSNKPSFSMYQPGEVYDLQALALISTHPVQGGEG